MIGIYVNLTRDIGAENAKLFMRELEKLNVEYAVLNDVNGSVRSELADVIDNLEFIAVFGGDGTILNMYKQLGEYNIPLLGINTGRLGFLAEVGTEEMSELADCLVNRLYTIDERFILKAEYANNKYYAVNDVSLSRGMSTHTLKINVKIDGLYTDSVSGDGMLVSTPTGSTAYALSCGGPILSPKLEVMTVLAICPHTLHSRPMVISNDSVVELTAENKERKAVLTIDSETILLKDSDYAKVTVTKSDRVIKFVRVKNENFYNRLLNKLNYWNTANGGK